MIDYIYPDPQFEEPYEDFTKSTEQRITDCETHQQSHGTILFNHNQELAIDAIVNSTCGKYPFLLFGPPGTGKTATLVECIHRITKMGKEKRILVCTPSNMAADVIAATILQRGIIEDKYVFRLNSLSFEYKKRNKLLDSIACIV
uniref:DNA2/NAM7 helicase helicase domain-containing protein n=1 Tax=Panagrolaimus sp. ES5 TaxID=591445 RepID=A0AC34FI84_9BILA